MLVDRVIRMNPGDLTVKYIFGMYHHRAGEIDDPLENDKASFVVDVSKAELP